jgi:hypothetical protein
VAIWLKKHSMIYVLAPRTASTATAKALVRKFGGSWMPAKDINDENGKRVLERKHASFSDIEKHNLLDPEEFSKALKVVTVRNPFDSVFSLWYKKTHQYWELRNDPDAFFQKIPGYVERMEAMRNQGFSDWFIQRYTPRSETDVNKAVYKRWTRGADHFMRFETLSQDFEALLDRLGINEKSAIQPDNVTKGRDRDYRKQYTDEARALGEKVFSRELKRFGYEF